MSIQLEPVRLGFAAVLDLPVPARRPGLRAVRLRPDGTGLMRLLGGIDAGFPGWKPRP